MPGTAQEIGLYEDGPTPGQLGPAVIAAHVDTPAGVPGIFHELLLDDSHIRTGNHVFLPMEMQGSCQP